MFSKRWYLLHLLGGCCKSCDNENLYDLEIDHTNNDGDVERYYHTNMIKFYIQNPDKAKMRLQVLCKKCHERKHSKQLSPSKFVNAMHNFINSEHRPVSRYAYLIEKYSETELDEVVQFIKFIVAPIHIKNGRRLGIKSILEDHFNYN